VKNSAGGTLSLRSESKKGDVISKCELPTAGDSKWTDVQCSNLPKLKGFQDFYLTAEGLGGETLIGNIKFGEAADTSKVSIPGNLRPNSGANRILRSGEMSQKGYHDLKGRRFDKQIPYRVMF
jgi:arabinan endo-1,5-alpha-L-arabinosidase